MGVGFVCAPVVFMVLAGTAVGQEDPYSLSIVRSRLRLPPGVSTASLDKNVYRLGDKASVALLKILREDQLTDRETVGRVLRLVSDAFSRPELIGVPEDRDPGVTLFLLSYLERSVADKKLKEQISRVRQLLPRAVTRR